MRTICLGSVLLGCHGVGETGPRGMVGVLTDVDGRPMSGVEIKTEEHGVTTDPEGRFEVRWKEPATFLTFRVGGIQWKRALIPGEPGQTQLTLPRVRDGEVLCRADTDCMAEVSWSAGEALTARADVPCGSRTPVLRVEGLPEAVPTVRCVTVMGELAFRVTEDQGRLLIRSLAQPVPVKLVGRPSSEGCTVHILDGEVVTGGGRVGLQPEGETYAWATCDGRVGPPVAVRPRQTGATDEQVTVSVPWYSAGVDLPLQPPVTGASELMLIRTGFGAGAAEPGAWRVRVPVSADGVYRLPPLPRGEYRLGLGGSRVLSKTNPPEPEIPGTVVWTVVEGEWGVTGGMVGALRLEENMASGVLRVDGYPPAAEAP